MAENLNRDAFRIRRGLDALGGNRLAGLIQSSNYQKILRSYRSRYVERRKDKKTGDLYWFDKKTNKRVTDQDIHKNVITNVTGSETPIKDLRYISSKQRANLESKLGALDDGVSVRDVLFNVRNKFSTPIKDEETGEVIGTELEDKRDKRAALMLEKAETLRKGTTYGRADQAKTDEALKSGTNQVLNQKVDKITTNLAKGKDIYNDQNASILEFSRGLKDGTLDTKNYNSKWVRDNLNLEGHWNGKVFVPHSTGDKKGSKGTNKFNIGLDFNEDLTKQATISGAKVDEETGDVEIPKKSWSDIKGMKRGRERDKLAIEYFKDKGIDLEANTRHKQRDIAKDLYIDNRVFVKDKGWTSIEDVEEGEKSTYHTRDGSGPHRTYSSD